MCICFLLDSLMRRSISLSYLDVKNQAKARAASLTLSKGFNNTITSTLKTQFIQIISFIQFGFYGGL